MIQSDSEYSEQIIKNLSVAGERVRSASFLDCTFDHCTMMEAEFQSCRFINCIFKSCDCSLLRIPGSTFSGSRFEATRLVGVNWSIAEWPDHGIREPLQFNRCALSHSTFLGVDLGAVKILHCEGVDVDFREASLIGADFAFTDLKDSLFWATDLSRADFRYARNYPIDPGQNKITKARFSLPEAMALLYSMDIELTES